MLQGLAVSRERGAGLADDIDGMAPFEKQAGLLKYPDFLPTPSGGGFAM